MDSENVKAPTFEEALCRLEDIVRRLESGDAPLDKSLELFEEGVRLVKECNCKLENARQKVTVLTAGGEKEMGAENNG